MKKLFITLQFALALTCAYAQKVYTLQDWNIKDYEPGRELRLNVSEYKIDDKNSLSSDFTLGVTKIIGFYFALERDNMTPINPSLAEDLAGIRGETDQDAWCSNG